MAGNSDIRSSDIYRDDPVRDTVIPLHVPYKADAADANAALAVGDGQVAYIVPDRGHIVAVTASLSDGGAGGTSTTIQLRRLHPIIAVPGTFDAGEDVLYDDAAHTPAIDQRLVVSGSADAAPAFAGITDADTFDPERRPGRRGRASVVPTSTGETRWCSTSTPWPRSGAT